MNDKTESEEIRQRRAKLARWRDGGRPWPNDFRPTALAAELAAAHGSDDEQALAAAPVEVRVAGRLMSRRVMGKAAFADLQDRSGRIQLFARKDDLGDDYEGLFKELNLGDIVGVGGVLFRTRSGELSVRAASLQLLAKALRPLPEKFHGLSDRELRHRRRHLDLIVNRDARGVFELRSRAIQYLREFLLARGYLEVETPMMHPIPGGAVARPFKTHHNALDMPLYLRVAPELYLKRLVVGGLERVFEINRSFRNEGLSTRHNPEFTMIEWYQAYADYRDFIKLSEEMVRGVVQAVSGGDVLRCRDREIDLAPPFEQMTLAASLLRHNPGLEPAALADERALRELASGLAIDTAHCGNRGQLLEKLFEKTVEPHLLQPTFITAMPIEVSPMSRPSDEHPQLADRFELYIGGHEIANGFSELNDPEEQARRFRLQAEAHAGGDPEALHYDGDYIEALEYGMPPAAGEGLGVDRLVMLLAGVESIREVLLFPLLRPAGSPEPRANPEAGTGGLMIRPVELYIGLRYTRARRRNHFISFISFISVLGVVVGVWALITVLSIMNGFEKELKERILSAASHVTVSATEGALRDWRAVVERLDAQAGAEAAAPFILGQGMVSANRRVGRGCWCAALSRRWSRTSVKSSTTSSRAPSASWRPGPGTSSSATNWRCGSTPNPARA